MRLTCQAATAAYVGKPSSAPRRLGYHLVLFLRRDLMTSSSFSLLKRGKSVDHLAYISSRAECLGNTAFTMFSTVTAFIVLGASWHPNFWVNIL